MTAAAERRKLSGYLRAVVSVPGVDASAASSIPPLSPCTLSACGAVALAPLPDDVGTQPRWPRWRAPGVVRLLRTLVANRCVEVEGTLLRVVTRKAGEGDGDGAEVEARAVLLLDVYLPVAAWSGWQFPRSRSAAAAVFKHVRCVSSVCVYLYWWNFDDPIAIFLRSGRHVPCIVHPNFGVLTA